MSLHLKKKKKNQSSLWWPVWILEHGSWFVTGPMWFASFNQIDQGLPGQVVPTSW